MRILICAVSAPVPPMDGFRLQLTHLCRRLARDHEVCVLAFGAAAEIEETPPGVELVVVPPPSRSVAVRAALAARAVAGGQPARMLSLAPPMSLAVSDLLADRSFDVAHVAGSALAGIAPELGETPSVLAAVDAWHLNVDAIANVAPLPKRPFYRLEARAVRRFGGRAYRGFDRVVVVSEEDERALRALDPGLEVEVVPNGVDAEHMSPNPEVAREPGLVVFIGAMQWAPNAEAAAFLAREVMPLLRAQRPEARLALVGRNPGPEVRALARLDGVEVTGEVADVRPWLWRASAFACAMVSGTGIKNKLLEALACGTPSAATSMSCQGLGATAGTQLLVADGAEAFASAVARLLSDAGLRERLGREGRALAEKRSWEGFARSYERIYDEITA